IAWLKRRHQQLSRFRGPADKREALESAYRQCLQSSQARVAGRRASLPRRCHGRGDSYPSGGDRGRHRISGQPPTLTRSNSIPARSTGWTALEALFARTLDPGSNH
ncbi:MAG: hypothetical protein ACLFQ2_06050, partial [Wenzhouxiangella sp.]